MSRPGDSTVRPSAGPGPGQSTVLRVGRGSARDIERVGLLTGSERDAMQRLGRQADRESYLAAHLLVRDCAAELLGRPAETLVLDQVCDRCAGDHVRGRRRHGRPRIRHHPEIYVSLSHTRGLVAAVASVRPCGVDVEVLRSSLSSRLPDQVLDPAERAWLADHPEPGLAALQIWTRKEALIKAGAGTLDQVADLCVVTEGRLVERMGDWSVRTESITDRAEPAVQSSALLSGALPPDTGSP